MTPARWWVKHAGPWFWVKCVIGLLAVADVVASSRLGDELTTQRPSVPQGSFSVPFQTHGGTTYISGAENRLNIALIVAGIVLVLAWWTVEHFEKRSRTR